MSNSISVNKNTDAFITNELSKFILEHTGQDALSAIDEIVLTYLISILESLGSSDSPQDEFDVKEFAEMMSAYIPLFANINSTDICEWMFNLAEWLRKATKNNEGKKSVEDTFLSLSRLVCPESGVLSSSPVSSSSSSSHSRSTSQSEDDEKNTNHIAQTIPEMNQELELLMEMFPHFSIMDVQHCFAIADGDCEKTVQLLLQKQDSGQHLGSHLVSPIIGKLNKTKSENAQDEKKQREQILSRYAYIDQDDDARDHKPVAPKAEPKKLIRYRDGKIVSIKGERFSDVKCEETEAQKKTYVSLKPARHYRFH